MRKLLLGNEAVARGLYEAGCRVASSYPGTPSTEVTESAAKYDEIYCEWAPNEKVAMETAGGAAIAGARSFCGMKHTPTCGMATRNKSGRCVIQAPTSKPPLEPPTIAILSLLVYLSLIRYSAAAMKSSNTFCFCIFVPAMCQSSPYSPPPRRLTCA